MDNQNCLGPCPKCGKQHYLVGNRRTCFICGMYQAFWGALWKAHHADHENEEHDVHDLGNRFMLHFYQMLTQRLAIGTLRWHQNSIRVSTKNGSKAKASGTMIIAM